MNKGLIDWLVTTVIIIIVIAVAITALMVAFKPYFSTLGIPT